MKRESLVLVVLGLLFCGVAQAEPIAPLAKLNAYGVQAMAAEGTSAAEMARDLPSAEMVGIPAYPGSLFANGGGEGEELTNLMLISKASAEDVVAWYRKNLGSDWQYAPQLAVKEAGQVGVFVNTDNKNISAMDSLRHRQLSVAKVEKPGDTGFIEMIFDVTGIRSMIVMTLKPMM